MKEIIFIGSSFTQGVGLGNADYIEYLKTKKDYLKDISYNNSFDYQDNLNFPSLVANHFNLPHTNYGNAGKGLSYVMRKVYLSKKINKDTLFILEFPPGPRFEIYYKKIRQYIVPALTPDMDKMAFNDDNAKGVEIKIDDNINELIKLHLLYRDFELEHLIQTYQFMSTVEFLKKNSNVIVLYGEHSNKQTDELIEKYIKNDVIELTEKYINFVDWSRDLEYTITDDSDELVEDAHFSYEAHRIIADFIIDKINKNFI